MTAPDRPRAGADAAPPSTDERVLEDLRRRVSAFRRVDLLPERDRRLGVDPALLERLLDEWEHRYDWRPFEHRVRALPWALIDDAAVPLRVVDRPAASDAAPVVVLLHGWPDSVMRFEKVLPALRDVHVVIPALPGYPFAAPVRAASPASAADIGEAVVAAMARLGHERYVVSAGDVGTDVAEAMAWSHPEHVAALHLTDLSHHHALVDPPTDLDADEAAYLQRVQRWHAEEGAYDHQQSTRPNTLAIGLGDSPVGLLAWIVEKLTTWSDDRSPAFSSTDLLDWVTAYWVTGTIGTSFAPYAHRSQPGRAPSPVGFTLFPRDIVSAPRRFADRFFDIRIWRTAAGGGHFDAWERPIDYADGIRAVVDATPRI
ncbi:epoxide hydrolase family protein [Amnibacterium setariae]|uniref:Epoxide hydrolase n=1 Tax=Amnibacterium setariae TaxID=2306585 RepID=A0A3A1TYG4_9MICO|nr:epoxide hydrolase family protein [Amnibacterium setariae]RIX28621.1 epoxide hydrolase [Amnibacterium setariae]